MLKSGIHGGKTTLPMMQCKIPPIRKSPKELISPTHSMKHILCSKPKIYSFYKYNP